MGGNQGDRLQRLLSILDPTPPDDNKSRAADESREDVEAKVSSRPARQKVMLVSNVRPLRVAFADADSSFMASPLVETYTRLAWAGQEYVMVGVKMYGIRTQSTTRLQIL